MAAPAASFDLRRGASRASVAAAVALPQAAEEASGIHQSSDILGNDNSVFFAKKEMQSSFSSGPTPPHVDDVRAKQSPGKQTADAVAPPSSGAGFGPAPAPAAAPAWNTAPYCAGRAVPPQCATAASTLRALASSLAAGNTFRQHYPSVWSSSSAHHGIPAPAVKNGAPSAALTQAAVKMLVPLETAAAAACPSAASECFSGRDCNSSSTFAGGNTWAAAGSLSDSATARPPPPPNSPCLAPGTRLEAPLSSLHAAATRPFSYAGYPPQCLREGGATGAAIQTSAMAVPCASAPANATEAVIGSRAALSFGGCPTTPVGSAAPWYTESALVTSPSSMSANVETVGPQHTAEVAPCAAFPQLFTALAAGLALGTVPRAVNCSGNGASFDGKLRRASSAAGPPATTAVLNDAEDAGIAVPRQICPALLSNRGSHPAAIPSTAPDAAVATDAVADGVTDAEAPRVSAAAAGASLHPGNYNIQGLSLLLRHELRRRQLPTCGAPAPKSFALNVAEGSVQDFFPPSGDTVTGAGTSCAATTTTVTSLAVAANERRSVLRIRKAVTCRPISAPQMSLPGSTARLVQTSFLPAAPTWRGRQLAELQKTAASVKFTAAAGRTGATAGQAAALEKGFFEAAGIKAAGVSSTNELFLSTVARGAAATRRVAASRIGAAASSRAGKDLAAAALRFGTAAVCATNSAPYSAGFLQRTKRGPREVHLRSRRLSSHNTNLHPNGHSSSAVGNIGNSSSHWTPSTSCAGSASASLASDAGPAASLRVIGGNAANTFHGAAIWAATAGSGTPQKARSLCFPSEAAVDVAAIGTPEQPQRPPWRALTPQQLLQQRASRKRSHAECSTSSHAFTANNLKAPSTASSNFNQNPCIKKANLCLKRAETAAGVGATPRAISAALPADATAQHTSAEGMHGSAGTAGEGPPALSLVTAAAGMPADSAMTPTVGARRHTPCTGAGKRAPTGDARATTPVDECRAMKVTADISCPREAKLLACTTGKAVLRSDEGRRTRKPSRLSLEAAETYSLTMAFRQQRQTCRRSRTGAAAARTGPSTASSPNRKRVDSGSSERASSPSSQAAVAKETAQQGAREPTTRTRRARDESSLKRHSVQQNQQKQQHLHQQIQEQEQDWIRLTSLQHRQATAYAAALRKQPVLLDSCSFLLYPPGFASSRSAVRRVCLSGTLQRPLYIPSAASVSSVEKTVERQQQEAVAAAKCSVRPYKVPAVARVADAACDTVSRAATVSSRTLEKRSSNQVDGSSNDVAADVRSGSEAGVQKAAPLEGREKRDVVEFIENTTVSGYIYHWYTRMHLSAQLETQLQHLSAARERLTKQLCGGSELHSNLFFFSLFPQDYGVEQFMHNLRFFPQYAVAAVAAERAGLKPLDRYADNSCTAAIAETTRRAKLTEQLYEEKDVSKRQRRAAEAAARSQQLQPSQPVVYRKRARAKETPSLQVKKQRTAPEFFLASAAAAAKLRQQGTRQRLLTEKTEENESEMFFAAADPGAALRAQNKISPGCMKPSTGEASALRPSKDTAVSAAAASAGAQGKAHTHETAGNTSECSAAVALGNGLFVEKTRLPDDSTASKTDSGKASTVTAAVSAYVISKPFSSAVVRELAAVMKSTSQSMPTGTQQQSAVKPRACEQQHPRILPEGERVREQPRQDKNTDTELQVRDGLRVSSNQRAAMGKTEKAGFTAAAAHGAGSGAHIAKDEHALQGETDKEVNALPVIKDSLSCSRHVRMNYNSFYPHSQSDVLVRTTSSSEPLAGEALFNRGCISSSSEENIQCTINITAARNSTDVDCCTCKIKLCGSCSCGGGGCTCVSSNRNCTGSTQYYKSGTCSGGDSSHESIHDIRNSAIEGELRSATGECKESGTPSGSHDASRSLRSDTERGGGGSRTGSGAVRRAAFFEKDTERRANCVRTRTANLEGRTLRTACESSSTAPGSGCQNRESSSGDMRQAEGVAEAQFFPVIPRVGTIEIAAVWQLIQATEQLLLELHQRQDQEKLPQELEQQLPVLVETLPAWGVGSVEWSMQQQLTALTLRRVLPDLAAWQGKDLRLVGRVLPFAVRGLLALALCQLEHRIAMLQQELAAAVGAVQVLTTSVLLLQQVEEHYAPPLYSLPQHVLTCLYSRAGGRAVLTTATRENPAAAKVKLQSSSPPRLMPSVVTMDSVAKVASTHLPAAKKQAEGDEEKWETEQKQKNGVQEKLPALATPSWETGIRQGAPIALDSFVPYTNLFEDYLPTLGREKISLLSVIKGDSEDALHVFPVTRRRTIKSQQGSRSGGASRSAAGRSRMRGGLEADIQKSKGRRKKLAGKSGESTTKDGKSRNSSSKVVDAKLKKRAKKEESTLSTALSRKRVAVAS